MVVKAQAWIVKLEVLAEVTSGDEAVRVKVPGVLIDRLVNDADALVVDFEIVPWIVPDGVKERLIVNDP